MTHKTLLIFDGINPKFSSPTIVSQFFLKGIANLLKGKIFYFPTQKRSKIRDTISSRMVFPVTSPIAASAAPEFAA